MATFAEMQAEIADDLARSDLGDQIKSAIKSAVRFYEGKRYWFNEKQSTFSLVAGQEYYTLTDLADIPNIFAIDSLKANVNGTNYPVQEKTYEFIDGISTSTTSVGDPIYFCLYNKKLRFYPIPNEVRVISVSYAYKPVALSADADTNVWTTEAYDMIKAKAKADVYENVLHDFAMADRMAQKSTGLNYALTCETEGRIGGNIKPTQF